MEALLDRIDSIELHLKEHLLDRINIGVIKEIEELVQHMDDNMYGKGNFLLGHAVDSVHISLKAVLELVHATYIPVPYWNAWVCKITEFQRVTRLVARNVIDSRDYLIRAFEEDLRLKAEDKRRNEMYGGVEF